MARNSDGRQRGQFESLEQRNLLAGDVLVNVVGNNLRIEGDAEGNEILITAGAEAGTFIVTGLDGTTLGGETDPVEVSGIRNIRVNLGDGADLVALAGAEVRGNVTVRTGLGDDRVLVGTEGGAAELAGVLPADATVNVSGSLKISTGAGLDQVAVDGATVSRLSVDAGEDNDVVSLGSTDALGDLSARLVARHGAHINLGDGNDDLNIDQVSTRGALIARGGVGDDTVNATVAEAAVMLVSTDGGIDGITLADLDVRHLGVHSGEGNDTVNVSDSVFTSLGIGLGAGDDTLTTSTLQARIALLGGGEGEDTLDEVAASVFAHQRIHGFEIPPEVNSPANNRRGLLGGLLARVLGRR
jgi:hypothetical protein